ncbi:succinic semialdehyde dehydrogenase [Smaragdicoccus niigatensis]|uniref:succinic semialdehyde dehydrogenase n=1 Tax=Smaragdicoccus niigatensis TaxID=359359 RepID=UPI000364B98E|nr:succinic semialdehyde dehydrogenase [Smaragdicoccus niigatensis]
MAVPSRADLERLRTLVAIDDVDSRPSKPITEVFTGTEIATIPVGTADDVLAAIANARTAQREWAARSPKKRAEVLERFRGLVFKHREFLMDVAQAETGKSRSAAQEEVVDLALNARYYAKEGPKLLAPQRVQSAMPGVMKTVVHHHPKGVVGVIAPWNYPMSLSISDAIPALMAGNGVVIKPDSQTPYCTLANVELLYEAGVPRDLLAVVPGPGSVVGTALVENCEYLMFTGSSATGRLLAEQAARRLIGISAELGGKNPMIVTKGANLDVVAQAATRACFSNAGQLCISIERIYVEEPAFGEFVEKFGQKVRDMKLGTAYDFTVDMGSLISDDQLATVSGHVEDAKAKGAKVIAGGKHRPDIGPLFFEPTVLTGVTDDMECARNETFGPLVSIYPVADVEEAITRANDSIYGLNASVWARSKSEGEAIGMRLRTGTVNVDEGYGAAFASTAAPMGGMGASGLGRRHGPEGLLKYTEAQTITTTSFINGDPPFGLPNAIWQEAFLPLFQVVQRLPGR